MSLVLSFTLLGGAAAAHAESPAVPTGVWQGFITGREMWTSNSEVVQHARLVIRTDRTWTLQTATWQASGTVVTRGGRLVLDGDFVTGNPDKRVGPARYDLSLWGDQALGGSGSAQFGGLHITTGVQLKKVQ